ncbi:MAG: 4-hydroxythreonine-4-phosphate dehydrogenase PdxA [Magnetococcales bacterium]|nr:4-hydroxythreonine-4-phosphate dehydrogenase PdxA [Magnetococcales bacterium]
MILAFTMGDPAGVGPEIVLKAHARRPSDAPPWLWIGDPRALRETARHLQLPAPLRLVDGPRDLLERPPGTLAVLPTGVEIGPLTLGTPDPRHAPAVMASLELAGRLALEGAVAAVVTPPLAKSVLHQGGFDLPGHTEFFAALCGVADPVMMLTGGGLRVALATIHQSLRSVPDAMTADGLRRVLSTLWRALRVDFALDHPRIAVAGLNPHAGEQGAFGDEEIRLLQPVCRELEQRWGEGSILGPLPADTMFHPEARRQYDAALAMYHDQGLIPLKMLAFGQAVNLTLGLPMVRTSVDHGTAFGIAGRGVADEGSLIAAARLATEVVIHRQQRAGLAEGEGGEVQR